MKAVAALLLILNFLTVSHGWTCKAAPQQFPAAQIDAGEGKVVMTDRNSNVFLLCGSIWFRVGSTALKHVSVGPAGMWGVDASDKVYKYESGDFILAKGRNLKQVDAGGDGQLLGVDASTYIYCVKSTDASAYTQVGSLTYNYLSGGYLAYISCSQLGCWGVNSAQQIYFTTITPATCALGGWKHISTGATMIEVGTDGNVFYVDKKGQIYQRTGITTSLPYGSGWTQIKNCLPVKHLSYDLGKLWLVTNGGLILQCSE